MSELGLSASAEGNTLTWFLFLFTWFIAGVIASIMAHCIFCAENDREFNEFTIQSLAVCFLVLICGYFSLFVATISGLVYFLNSDVASRVHKIDTSKWKTKDDSKG